MIKINAVLFDLDGVLTDTEGTYTQFWSDVDRRYHTGIDNFALVIKGNTLDNILSTYFPDPDTQRLIRADLADFEAKMRYQLFDGVLPLLDVLKCNNIPAAIVTSSNSVKMDGLFAQLPGFRENFAAVITDEDISRSKPDPEGYILAAKRLGVDPTLCAVFEDSVAGVMAGKASGAFVVGVATTNTPDKLCDIADIVIGSMGEALAALRRAARRAD